MTLLFIDLETRSAVDLPKRGSYVYYESLTTDVLMACYAFDDGPVQSWVRGDPVPPAITAHIEQGGMVSGWNVFGFERLAFENVLGPRYGWPVPRMDQYTDTMHMAAAMALPRALGNAAEALGLPFQKDKEGMRLIRKFSMPRKANKREQEAWYYNMQVCGGDIEAARARAHEIGERVPLDYTENRYWNEPEDHPEDFAKFLDYCRLDVEVERAARKRLVPLSEAEQALTVLDATINQRGLRIDTRSARSAINMADKAKKALDREMRIVTGGYVTACSQPGKLVEWVAAQGIEIGSAAKAEITDLLEADDLPANVRKALELRQEAAKTSVSKLNSMLARVNADGRIRGSSLYHGASTGRFQSAGVNFSNLPRSRPCYEAVRPDTLFRAFKTEEPEILPFLWGDEIGRSLHLISDAIRGFIWAAPGHDLMQADYSNIEGNVIAWLAGEEWKLEAVRAINADPALPDMYLRTASGILGIPLSEMTKKHWARQAVGKPAELGLSYQGSVMAFVTFARNYGVDLEPIAPSIIAQADGERYERAAKRYEGQLKLGKGGTQELSRDAWIACHVVVQGWRAQNTAIAQSWKDLEAAVREAVQNPGTVTEAAKVRYRVAKGFLWALLPSGRCLAYGSPKLKDQVWAKIKLDDGEWSDAEVMEREAAEAGERRGTIKIEGDTSAKVTVLGVDSVTKKWRRFGLYGGLIAENNTQAVARDILVNGMWKAENAGYPIIATVYDELICEVPRGWGSVGEFERLICELPEWADGLPLTAGGWRGKRYRKD